MKKDFPTKEELMKLPLSVVRGLDIRNKEQEDAVQEVVTLRLKSLPPERTVNRKDVPDIRSGEEEAKWQAIINERENHIKGINQEEIPESVMPLEVVSDNQPSAQIEPKQVVKKARKATK